MTKPTNDERAARAQAALRQYIEAKSEPFEDNTSEIIDLITDLLHYAEQIAQDDDAADSALFLAKMHFEAEIAEAEEFEVQS